MLKKFVLLFFLLFLFLPKTSFASSNAAISTWAQTIGDNLQKKQPNNCLYNKQPNKNICSGNQCAAKRAGDCNGFWPGYLCTQLVKDSYHLAGFSRGFSSRVFKMVKTWQNFPGYKLLTQNNQATINQLQPGDVIFMGSRPDSFVKENGGGRHVIIITSVKVNSYGDGVLEAVQANGVQTKAVNYIRTWQLKLYYGVKTAGIFWFGLAPRLKCLPYGAECGTNSQCCSNSCQYDVSAHLSICGSQSI